MKMMRNNDYSLRIIAHGLLGLIFLCAAMKATGGAGFVLIFIPCLIAFSKNRINLLAFLLMTTAIITVCNRAIAPKDFIFSISTRFFYILVATTMFFQNTGRKTAKQLIPILTIFIYVFYEAIVSSVGFSPLISYLKIILFSAGLLAFFGMANAAYHANSSATSTLRNIILIFSIFIIGGSFLLIPFPGIAQMGAAEALEMGLPVESIGLFQGITYQPQTLGPAVSTLSVILFADALFLLKRWDKLYLILLLLAPILIFYTSSRTAMGTYLAGMFFTIFIFMQAHGVGSRWKIKAMNAITLIGLFSAFVLFSTPQMRHAVANFALKFGDAENTELSYENLTATRQGLMEVSINNFKKSPWIGNGFQVAQYHENMTIRSWKQLLSAPIEKGVWITAVLEEGGIFGMIIFVIFLLIAFFGLLRRKAYIGVCVLFTFLVSNLGEFTFFSISANGGMMWAMTFIGIALNAQHIRLQNQNHFLMVYPQTNPYLSSTQYPQTNVYVTQQGRSHMH